MVVESIHGQMAVATTVAGNKTSCTAKVNILGLMAGSTKETTTETKSTAMDCMSGPMASPTRGTGSKACAMDKVSSVTRKVNSVLGSGLKGKGKNGSLVASNK